MTSSPILATAKTRSNENEIKIDDSTHLHCSGATVVGMSQCPNTASSFSKFYSPPAYTSQDSASSYYYQNQMVAAALHQYQTFNHSSSANSVNFSVNSLVNNLPNSTSPNTQLEHHWRSTPVSISPNAGNKADSSSSTSSSSSSSPNTATGSATTHTSDYYSINYDNNTSNENNHSSSSIFATMASSGTDSTSSLFPTVSSSSNMKPTANVSSLYGLYSSENNPYSNYYYNATSQQANRQAYSNSYFDSAALVGSVAMKQDSDSLVKKSPCSTTSSSSLSLSSSSFVSSPMPNTTAANSASSAVVAPPTLSPKLPPVSSQNIKTESFEWLKPAKSQSSNKCKFSFIFFSRQKLASSV